MNGSDEHPRSLVVNVLDGVAALLILVSFLLPLLSWPGIPDRVPQHFNIFGEPDGWGGKGSLFILPIVSLIAFGLFSFAAGSPIANYPFAITGENAGRQYAIARTFMTVLKVWFTATLMYIEWMMIRISRGNARDLGMFGVVAVGVAAVIAGTYLVRAYRAR